jgi:hypothetical protein
MILGKYTDEQIIEYLSESIETCDEEAYFPNFEDTFIEMIERLEEDKELTLNQLSIIKQFEEDIDLYIKETQ